jgi:restriction system protein
MPIAPTVKSIMLPRYGVAQRLLCTLSGRARSTVTGMIRSVYLWSGTPGEPRTRSNRLEWIDSLLEGAERDLAHRIWKDSGNTINPRYVKGAHLFLNKHGLMSVRDDGCYMITLKGIRFERNEFRTVAEIDTGEGLLELLNLASSLSSRGTDLCEVAGFRGDYVDIQT